MSASWRLPGRPCQHPRCLRRAHVQEVALATAYISLGCVLITPYRLLFAVLLVAAATVTVAAAGTRCPHRDDGSDLEALIHATREDRKD